IQDLVLAGKHLDAVNVHESLPASLKDDGLNPDTAWYLGEAFRHMGQPGRAVLFYHGAARASQEGPDRSTAELWDGVTTGQALELVRGKPSQANILRQAMQSADQDMWKSWEGLPQAEKEKIFTSMKPDLEAAAKDKGFLKSPPRIVLSAWDQALGTEITAT